MRTPLETSTAKEDGTHNVGPPSPAPNVTNGVRPPARQERRGTQTRDRWARHGPRAPRDRNTAAPGHPREPKEARMDFYGMILAYFTISGRR